MNTPNQKTKKVVAKSAVFLLAVSILFLPILPTLEALAKSKAQAESEILVQPSLETTTVMESKKAVLEETPETIKTEETSPETPTPIKEKELPKPTEIAPQTKFKKDSSLSVADQLALVRKHILDNNLPKEALDRLDQYELEQKSFAQNVLADVVPSDTVLNKEPFKVETFEGKISKRDAKEYEKDFAPNNVRQPRGGVDPNPNSYLSEGNEIQFSQSIKDQSDALGKNPLKILNFVRNNIEYVPYFGSKKGADATLVEKAGNDMDKASLMIAMLRYKDIPARYRHIYAKMDIRTVTDLLGVETAESAAEVLSLTKVPYILYYDSTTNEPTFFVIEHVYTEAYIPYGYSRGADINDGGTPQWVPMDPTINSYYHEQLIDVVDHLNTNGFAVEDFFQNYLEGDYDALEPLGAFKSVVAQKLSANPPTYYPNLTYDDALTKKYPKIQNLEFIPGSLPYATALSYNTYNFLPDILRHTLNFNVKDKENIEILNHKSYISDLADSELLISYIPATPADQTIIDSFDTIYDVVPLSLVNVRPAIKVNGRIIASASVNTTLGQNQRYEINFARPEHRNMLDETFDFIQFKTYDEDMVSGNTYAIAINTDRVIPPELRPTQDTTTTSYVSDQLLYSTALDYLNRYQSSSDALSAIIGGRQLIIASKTSISNGLSITKQNGEPYSFDWQGLRIDANFTSKYYNHFHSNTNLYHKEFTALATMQASQNESDIFEDNFGVESIATVKGLKLVNTAQFAGTIMKKITSANESEIDSLQISNSTKTVFHQAIADGRIIYTPTKPVTYGTWDGLFYITIDFEGGDASYTIGEGLNGGYTVENFDSGWTNTFLRNLPFLTAQIIKPLNNQQFIQNGLVSIINWEARYTSPLHSWIEKRVMPATMFTVGNHELKSGYGTNQKVNIKIQKQQLGNSYTDFDDKLIEIANRYPLPGYPDGIPPDLLKSVIYQESLHKYDEQAGGEVFDPKSYRYEAHVDYNWYSRQSSSIPAQIGWVGINRHPENHFTIAGKNAVGETIPQGNLLPSESAYLEWSKHTSGYPNGLNMTDRNNDGKVTAQELYDNNNDYYWKKYRGPNQNWEFTPQFILASSYGLTQVLFETAKNRGFFTGYPDGRPIEDLFNPEVIIDLSAKELKKQFNLRNHDWGPALNAYNGGGNPQYSVDVLNRWRNGDGDFKLLIKN